MRDFVRCVPTQVTYFCLNTIVRSGELPVLRNIEVEWADDGVGPVVDVSKRVVGDCMRILRKERRLYAKIS